MRLAILTSQLHHFVNILYILIGDKKKGLDCSSTLLTKIFTWCRRESNPLVKILAVKLLVATLGHQPHRYHFQVFLAAS